MQSTLFYYTSNHYLNLIENEDFFLIQGAKLLDADWLNFKMFLCAFHVGHLIASYIVYFIPQRFKATLINIYSAVYILCLCKYSHMQSTLHYYIVDIR